MQLTEDLLPFRNPEFLNIIKHFYRKQPHLGIDLVNSFDPNSLRKRGINLPLLMANVTDIFGARYNVNVNDHIGWNLFCKGFFDVVPVTLAKLLRACGSSGVYIDAGANIGSTSIPLGLDGIHIFAIEASNSTASELLKNISLNPGIRVAAINSALVSGRQLAENQWSTIYRSEGNFAAGSLLPDWNVSGSQLEENCLNTTLDLVVKHHRIDKILLVKMDIEGYEYFALEGFQDTLKRLNPPLLFEWRPDYLVRSVGRADDPRNLFPSSYRFYSAQSQLLVNEKQTISCAIRLAPADMSFAHENVFALPEEMLNHPHLKLATERFITL